jgi:aryl-alcohol dehydrogenase-like predicted oxidoreductase
MSSLATVSRIADELPKVRLGRTAMDITRVGFGGWAIGGPDWAVGWGPQDDKESIAAIRHAVNRGINWIDTAAAYGLGHSEEIIRRALQSLPVSQRPYVFTKCGLVWDENNRSAMPSRIGARASIRREVEGSLRRLGVDCIDLYQMHWPATDGTGLAEYWQTLLELKKEGKVAAVGLSNHSIAHLEIAARIGHVDTLQPPFSAIRRDAAVAELPWCATHETGVIVYSPMQSGLLSGRFSIERARALTSSDWRSRGAEFTGEKLMRNLELAEALRPIAERYETSVASIAIAWTLAWPGVTGAIVGARRPAQIDAWIDAATLTLSAADVELIGRAIGWTRAGSGPTHPKEGAQKL